MCCHGKFKWSLPGRLQGCSLTWRERRWNGVPLAVGRAAAVCCVCICVLTDPWRAEVQCCWLIFTDFISLVAAQLMVSVNTNQGLAFGVGVFVVVAMSDQAKLRFGSWCKDRKNGFALPVIQSVLLAWKTFRLQTPSRSPQLPSQSSSLWI